MGDGAPPPDGEAAGGSGAGQGPGIDIRDGGDQKNPPPTGHPVSGPGPAGASVTPRAVAVALKATDPAWEIRKRIRVVAEALRAPESTIRNIIERTPELRAAYGTTGKLFPASLPKAPTALELAERDEDDAPPAATAPAGTELLELVSAAENELHMKSLAALGVHEKTIDKLRKLEGMASSTGAFIAIGLQKTHRLYYLAVVDLKTVADQIKERYLDDPEAVTDEQRPFYYRNYIDAVKEFGRAYESFIEGAALILKIVNNDAGGDDGKKKRLKPGFAGKPLRDASG